MKEEMQNRTACSEQTMEGTRERAVGQFCKGTLVSGGTNEEGPIKGGSPLEKLTSQILSFLQCKIWCGLDYMISELSSSCQMLLRIKTVLIVNFLDQFHLDTLEMSQEG